jgi:hypothetical protein
VSTSEPKKKSAAEPGWQRKRRLAEVFGDVLPDTTSDERDPGEQSGRDDGGDAWLKEQVPPHHGG